MNDKFKKDKKGGTATEEKQKATVFNVDCNAVPRIPRGLRLVGPNAKHLRMGVVRVELRDGKLYANDREVSLVSCSDPKTGAMLSHDDIVQAISGKPALNACFRDFLADNVKMIPQSWKGKSVFFLNTAFSAPNNDPCVPCLYENCGWSWYDPMLGKHEVFGKNAYVAVLS